MREYPYLHCSGRRLNLKGLGVTQQKHLSHQAKLLFEGVKKLKRVNQRQFARQVFSRSVATAMTLLAELSIGSNHPSAHYLDPKATDTADLFLFLDELFDSLNTSQIAVHPVKEANAECVACNFLLNIFAFQLPQSMPIYSTPETLDCNNPPDFATTNVAGVVAKAKKMLAQVECPNCRGILESSDDRRHNIIIKRREYVMGARHLSRPFTQFFKAFRHMANVIFFLLPKFVTSYGIRKKIIDHLRTEEDIGHVFCAEHQENTYLMHKNVFSERIQKAHSGNAASSVFGTPSSILRERTAIVDWAMEILKTGESLQKEEQQRLRLKDKKEQERLRFEEKEEHKQEQDRRHRELIETLAIRDEQLEARLNQKMETSLQAVNQKGIRAGKKTLRASHRRGQQFRGEF
ncbi:hypothetical protein HUJ04_001419 [Dendroctonus ponderosae]|nr:hypothetical protein HUJ04_001419 [Dendroctonus ponderosae]